MSLQCVVSRSRLAALAAGRATDADRLEVEIHLAGCAACREEQARWRVIRRLDRYDPELSSAARDRVREAMHGAASEQVSSARDVTRPTASTARFALAMAAAVALALGVAGFLLRGGGGGALVSTVLDGDVLLEGRRVAVGAIIGAEARLDAGPAGGSVRLDGPRVDLRPGARASWSHARRTVKLLAGEVVVEVDPDKGRRFRVATPRFIAEVAGTRFTVGMDGVHTERGRVRVLSLEERELVVLGAGQSFRIAADDAPASNAAGPSSAPASTTSMTHSAPAPTAGPTITTARPLTSSGTHVPPAPAVPPSLIRGLLEQARAAVSRGDGPASRALVARVLAERPADDLAAEADSIAAESFLVEGRKAEAARRNHGVAKQHPASPQAESALFAAAQFELELLDRDAARRSFAEYLARYPQGRFRGEAQARLARLGTPDPPARTPGEDAPVPHRPAGPPARTPTDDAP